MRLAIVLAVCAAPAFASLWQMEGFDAPTTNWETVTDRVMGGASSGALQIKGGTLTLTGTLRNGRGNFVMARRMMPGGLPHDTTAIRVRLRGSGAAIQIILRTASAAHPSRVYTATLPATRNWDTHRAALSDFVQQSGYLAPVPRPGDIESFGIAAVNGSGPIWIEIDEIILD